MNGVELIYEYSNLACSYIDVHIPLNIFIENIRDFNLIKEYGSMRVRTVVQLLENEEFFTKVGGNSAVPMCCSILSNSGCIGINIVLDPPIQIYG
jgi:hypothetical protein